jgi:hypothetical protein
MWDEHAVAKAIERDIEHDIPDEVLANKISRAESHGAKTMTNEELNEIERLAKAVHLGPWGMMPVTDNACKLINVLNPVVPKMVARIRELEAKLERCQCVFNGEPNADTN